MSFTRNRYQVQDYKKNLQETIGPGNYNLNLPRNDYEGCFNPVLYNSKLGGSNCQNLVDVDSELMGLNYKDTKCPSRKYLPSNENFKNCNLKKYKDCPIFTGEATRLSNPSMNLRGTGWNRWEWHCRNHQDFAIEPFTRIIDTRIISKDNHRPCIPNLIGITALPSQEKQVNISGDTNFLINDQNIVMYNDQDYLLNSPEQNFNSITDSCSTQKRYQL
jgi:hypothetical protein